MSALGHKLLETPSRGDLIRSAALEADAQRNGQARSSGPVSPLATGTLDSYTGLPGGAPLRAVDRSYAESKLGGDFSRVRVHSDGEAAQAADSMGAQAFAFGSDVVFNTGQYAPGTPSGCSLLLHELTHTLQQSTAGEPAVQMQPKKDTEGGIGAAPPKEEFFVSDKDGAEDNFVLFAYNQAALTPASQKRLLAALKDHKEPATIVIHGYASDEGGADYNRNLSAHRAAAVKRFVDKHAPKDSRVTLYAHGETTSFGASENNRRAGFTVRAGVNPAAPAKKDDDWSLDPTAPGGKPKPPHFTLTFPKTSGVLLPPGSLLPPAQLTPPRSLLHIDPLPHVTITPLLPPILEQPLTFTEIDWPGIYPRFTARGVRMDNVDILAIETHFSYSYSWFRMFVSRDKAIWAANKSLGFVVDTHLAAEHPNAFDRAEKEWKIAYPDAISTPIFPIITGEF